MQGVNGNGRAQNDPAPDEIARRAAELREQREPAKFRAAEPAARRARGTVPLEEEIVEAIGEETLQGKEISRRLGLDPEYSTIRLKLSAMRKAGVLDHVPGEGYCLALPKPPAPPPPPSVEARAFRILRHELRMLRKLVSKLVRREVHSRIVDVVRRAVEDKTLPPMDDMDAEILRALDAATEPLMARALGKAIGMDEDNSTFREHLGPQGPLRRRGYVSHSRAEGYTITAAGRVFLKQ